MPSLILNFCYHSNTVRRQLWNNTIKHKIHLRETVFSRSMTLWWQKLFAFMDSKTRSGDNVKIWSNLSREIREEHVSVYLRDQSLERARRGLRQMGKTMFTVSGPSHLRNILFAPSSPFPIITSSPHLNHQDMLTRIILNSPHLLAVFTWVFF